MHAPIELHANVNAIFAAERIVATADELVPADDDAALLYWETIAEAASEAHAGLAGKVRRRDHYEGLLAEAQAAAR